MDKDCEKYQSLLSGLVDGRLSDEDKQNLMGHIDQCPECKAVFEKMQADAGSYEPAESYPGEYMEYMSAYLDNVIFPGGDWESRLAGLKDPLSVINFGIQIELDSILYYHEIKRFIPEAQHKMIDKIIEEERTHFLKLLDVKKERTK